MVASTANAAEFEMRQASDLDDLLKLVKERALFESAVNKDREREFIQKKAQQQSMLNSAKAERTAQEQRSDRLETQFEENERRLRSASGAAGYAARLPSRTLWRPPASGWGYGGCLRRVRW